MSGLAANLKPLADHITGLGQTWQDVKASRAVGVTYTNTTGKTILVAVNVNSASAISSRTSFSINGVVTGQGSTANSHYTGYHSDEWTALFPVENNQTYSINDVAGVASIITWRELR